MHFIFIMKEAYATDDEVIRDDLVHEWLNRQHSNRGNLVSLMELLPDQASNFHHRNHCLHHKINKSHRIGLKVQLHHRDLL